MLQLLQKTIVRNSKEHNIQLCPVLAKPLMVSKNLAQIGFFLNLCMLAGTHDAMVIYQQLTSKRYGSVIG